MKVCLNGNNRNPPTAYIARHVYMKGIGNSLVALTSALNFYSYAYIAVPLGEGALSVHTASM